MAGRKETEMEQVIEQGNYYRVVERNGKYYPEFWSTIHNQWDPYLEDGSVVELNSTEEVKDFWQKKEF